jgi:hypothetical protein
MSTARKGKNKQRIISNTVRIDEGYQSPADPVAHTLSTVDR